jgi:hypothetical protein
MVVVADTKHFESFAQSDEQKSLSTTASNSSSLYPTPSDALKAVRDDYLYWTGRLTDTSLQLSYAIIAANWAVFGSVDKLLANSWSKFSVMVVIVGLGLNVVGVKLMSEQHKSRINYAEANLSRWRLQFEQNTGRVDPWPYTKKIELLGYAMREVKTWFPLIAGVFFIIALMK